MEFDIRIEDINESNEFLKRLWCGLEREFGKCAWQYVPFKDVKNNTITFGFLDLGLGIRSSLMVSISYKRKGSIEKLYFNFDSGNPINDGIVERISTSVKSALNKQFNKEVFQVEVEIHSYEKLAQYIGGNFSIFPTKSKGISLLHFYIEAFNGKQAHIEIEDKMDVLIDLLAVDTNQIFTYRIISSPIYKIESFKIKNEFVKGSIDIRDENRIIKVDGEKYLLLSDDIFKQLNRLLDRKYNINPKEQKIYLSSKHFHTGLKMYENNKGIIKVAPTIHGNSFEEFALTSYLSALEVISNSNQKIERCNECNQPVYSIKKRVVNKVSEKFPYGSISKSIGEYYDVRSKFLHAGQSIIDMGYNGHSIPQLSLSDKTGCKRNFSDIDISGVNYAVRSILIDEIVELSDGETVELK